MPAGDAPPPPPIGLTEAEASTRRAAGQGNDVVLRTGRTYAQIVRDNVFNVINNLLFALGVTLILLGRWLDAVVAVGVVLANTVVSLFQEIRAKRTLDRIAILTRPKAIVLRDGAEREVDPTELVLGDVVVVHAGDQIVVDGRLAEGGPLEVDESLLTGESDLVPKRPGAELLSGSFVNSGGGRYVAERVGMESFANRITSQAQAHRHVLTPLQHQVSVIIRILLGLVVVFEALVIVKSAVGHVPFVETVRMSTVIVALIPNGLILAIALSYALGAVRMAGKGTLIQQSNAVESLSNVDVLCTDKTGTLTTNAIRFEALEPFEATEEEFRTLLGAFTAGVTEANRTALALAEAFAGAGNGRAGADAADEVADEPAASAASAAFAAPTDEALFSSQRKWSGLTFDSGPARGTLVLGAPEVIAAALASDVERDLILRNQHLDEWSARGLRVLLLARRSEPLPFPRPDGHPELPDLLVPLGLVCLRDELRPNVEETLAEFKQAGIAIKVISGDNPKTVAALAAQAGLAERPDRVSGGELAAMSEADFAQAAAETQVFGRVTPEQKESLAGALRDRGHYVAMIGDGVNDVIALKRANLGIAMQGGSQAARAVADMILMKDSFAALPAAFSEGQRIRNGMVDVLRIFMVRIFSKALLIAALLPLGGFPFAPRNSSLFSFLGAGIPVIGLTIWAIPGRPLKGSIYRPLVRFALPPTLLIAALGLPLHLWVRERYEDAFLATHAAATAQQALDYALPYAQTSTIVFMILCSLLLLPFTVPPVRFFAGGTPLRGDWRPTWLALGLAGFLALTLAFPLTRTVWELTALPLWLYGVCVGLVVVWGLLLKGIWRSGVLDRLLKLPRAQATDDD